MKPNIELTKLETRHDWNLVFWVFVLGLFTGAAAVLFGLAFGGAA